jgi:hypothetical protein
MTVTRSDLTDYFMDAFLTCTDHVNALRFLESCLEGTKIKKPFILIGSDPYCFKTFLKTIFGSHMLYMSAGKLKNFRTQTMIIRYDYENIDIDEIYTHVQNDTVETPIHLNLGPFNFKYPTNFNVLITAPSVEAVQKYVDRGCILIHTSSDREIKAARHQYAKGMAKYYEHKYEHYGIEISDTIIYTQSNGGPVTCKTQEFGYG